jgi:hypothetical protein
MTDLRKTNFACFLLYTASRLKIKRHDSRRETRGRGRGPVGVGRGIRI